MKSLKSLPVLFTGFLMALSWFSPPSAQAGDNLWTTQGPPGAVWHLAADPSAGRTLYATSYSDTGWSFFKSVNGGDSWFAFSPGDLADTEVRCLAIDPTQPANVYIGVYHYADNSLGASVLRSRDGGGHWENGAREGSAYPLSLAVAEGAGVVYMGTYGYPVGVLKSPDGGSTWSSTALASPHASYALLADSLSGTLLVGTDFGYSYEGPMGYLTGHGGNVAQTHDGGATWSLSPTDLGSSVWALAKDSPGSVYYAGTASGTLFRSRDGGANWSLLATLPGAVLALAVDPAASSVLYAATPNRGVLRSTDGGASWRSFNAGMSTRSVTSLAIDSTGQVLHVGTDQGVFDLRIAPSPEPAPCAPGADHLCFLGSRFRVDLTAVDPFTRTPLAAHAVPGNSRSGYFTFPSLTGDATLPEVFVKMVDATSLPGSGYWVYYAGLTSLLYTLRITDTTTGLAREYSGENSCGGADVFGFLPGASAETAMSTLTAIAPRQTASQPDLALLGGRFRVTLTARNPVTETLAAGVAISQGDRFGSFSLPDFTGDPGLPEALVKMIDAGGGSFLFFYTGLTSLDYAVTVLDTVTGTERTYKKENADPKRPCGGAELLMFGE